MKKFKFILLAAFYLNNVTAQTISDEYTKLIARADSCKLEKKYKDATSFYTQAFESNFGKGKIKDRYNSAICWTLIGNKDSAFIQLEKIANTGKFTQYQILESNLDFMPLKSDERWRRIILLIKSYSQQVN